MINTYDTFSGLVSHVGQIKTNCTGIETLTSFYQNSQFKLGTEILIVDTKLIIFILSPFAVIFCFILTLLAYKVLRQFGPFKHRLTQTASTHLLQASESNKQRRNKSKSSNNDNPYLPFDNHIRDNHSQQPQTNGELPRNTTHKMSSSSNAPSHLPPDPMDKYEQISPELGVGIERWNAIRQAWTSPSTSAPSTSDTTTDNKKPKKYYTVDADTIVEHLVNPKKPAFKHPVPLAEMVKILIELWEADGLFD